MPKSQGAKFKKVMDEFGAGKLKSSSGQKITNQKQAVAIAYSVQERAMRRKGKRSMVG